MGLSNSKLRDEIMAELHGMNAELHGMKAELAKLDRIDKRTALMVEAKCRKTMNMEAKEVRGLHDALCILFAEPKGEDFDRAFKNLVEKTYRQGTQQLFARITGKEWVDEKEAFKALNTWKRVSKENKSNNRAAPADSDESYSARAEIDVVQKFIQILRPFDDENVDKKKAHERAKQILRFDESGLALSSIIATLDGEGTWAWTVLDFDGFSSPHPTSISLLEVQCGDSSLETAKKQLDLRTHFIDAVAKLAGYTGQPFKITKYAMWDGATGETSVVEKVDDYKYISELTHETRSE